MSWIPPQDLSIFDGQKLTQHVVLGRPYRSAYNSLLFLKAGWIRICHNFETTQLEANTLLLIRSNGIYEFEAFSTDMQLLVLHINSNFQSVAAIKIPRYDTGILFQNSVLGHYQLTDDEFSELWQQLQVLNVRLILESKSRFGKEVIHHLFLSLIYMLADTTNRYNQASLRELNRGEKMVVGFMALLSTNARKERQVSYYAQQLGISAKHLSETIKEKTGHTAGEYINQTLLNEAKVLLADPKTNIGSVARELGFSDQFAFSKFFKRLTDLSPSAFRARL